MRAHKLLLSSAIWLLCLSVALGLASSANASSGHHAVERDYTTAANAPMRQTQADMEQKNAGCVSCHTDSDNKTMHTNPAIKLACTDCHGGNSTVQRPNQNGVVADIVSKPYQQAMEQAHVLPLYPREWNYPSSANPQRTYTLLNREAPEFIRFINPSDYRVAREACGACHLPIIEASERSMHSTGIMLWGGASYNNGILPYKNYILGEAYNRDGDAIVLKGPKVPDAIKDQVAAQGIVPEIHPLPAWETIKPGDVFRVFERGGRNISNLFPETGLPNSLGQLQRIEEPGRPDFRQSNRGEGTGARISVPVINITKTRLNDPFTWFMGTNDQPGDYRHSGPYAKYGHEGKTVTADPTISKTESGHPLQHAFTRSVPTSQCMICHMHQPNMFMNTFLGYTMWDYESDAQAMWPEQQQYPSQEKIREVLDRNPEGAAPRGKWGDTEFLKNVSSLNPQLKDTQFADYHGHGWNFRAVFKRDRKGNLLDAAGEKVSNTDPQKFKKAVHMSSIHVDAGMQCVDCHYSQDSHGNGHIVGEVALAVEIGCKDCHGNARAYPNLFTSGPAALEGGMDLSALRTPDGRKRFEWRSGSLYQRSMVDAAKEWRVSLVKDSVTPGNAHYNEKSARAKLMSNNTQSQHFGLQVADDQLAHSDKDMECYTCHTSWTTSCGGCHLPIEANAKTERHHYEGGETRNYATYNPQVARDEMYMLGKHSPAKGGKWAPTRSTSALVLSSTNSSREKIYIQQPPIAASGFSSQAFNPHFPHTERKTETKTCDDCHLSKNNDNNAIMSQLLMLGTNYINFVGYYAWVGGESSVDGVQVTEWDEPQAVIGSYLHRYAYPDWYKQHQDRGGELQHGESHGAGKAQCIQMRGEYLYVAGGDDGFRVFDIASIANKGVSERIVTGPFSALGHDTHIDSANATCMALASTQPIHPARNTGDLMRKDNMEQPFHPIYNYAVITDAEEGLILTDINTLADGEPRNNFLTRKLTWNEGGILKGARHITLGGYYAYIMADAGLVILNLNDPLHPKVASVVALNHGNASALQFRYLFVTDADGLKVVDVTHPDKAFVVANNTIALPDAKRVYVARTYAYVAAGKDGIVIVDAEKPEQLRLYQKFTANGKIRDAHDVIVASTNASAFAYVADGDGGLKVLQLTAPDTQPNFYGFAPEPKPQLIAHYKTASAALSLSKGLDRDRGVDETGGQISVFGRKGARPANMTEMQKLYLDPNGEPWFVK